MPFNCLITTLGQAKIATAISSGTPVNATHIAIGDGNGNATTPAVSQTALVREVYRTNVSSISVNPQDSSQVIFEAVIAASVGGWTARELGLFDSTGSLIAVANIGSVYKPTVAEGSAREMVVRIYAQVDQVGAINLVVDPSFYIATRSWVQSNFSIAALLPGGTTGQILRKRSNTSGDTEWANPLSAQNITVNVVEELQTLAASQTVVNLATATTAGMAVYVEGIRLRPNQLTVNTATQFTLASSYPAGSKLLAVQNDPAAALNYLSKVNNLSELTATAATARTNLGLGTIATAAAGSYVATAGSTMTGALTLSGAPTAALHAASKAYADGTVSKAASGYQVLPSGIIIQWGTFTSNGSISFGTPQLITLPIAFPNAIVFAIASEDGGSTGGTETSTMDWTTPGKTSLSQVGIYTNYIGVCKYIAIGY
jgi:phage-related tail fiber protein